MKIHLIFNAHIDPVWLWPWQAGLDEVLATCRSACDRLDRHQDLVFTRGEAWVYRQIERIEPELSERIRKHITAGRWEIVGGWWLQPDCNLPGGVGMQRQIELGKRYLEAKFGIFPRIAYNVDSFGHAATLPAQMRAFGQDRYIMMRPQEHEMDLPARLFRWRGFEDGPEVATFRIANAYTSRELNHAHIEAALTALPPGIEHTMCFVGVGDHGGGPTEGQIAWLREHWNDFPGHTLEFSSPQRFFEAIEGQLSDLPLVTGELQQHAIGCYSVYRPIKTAVQKAEHKLIQAESMLRRVGITDITVSLDEDVSSLDLAWQRVCFGHFHDTIGGTCLPSAYPQELERLGFAASIADESAQIALRRLLPELPDDLNQRIVLFNASEQRFDDFVEFEPWLEWQRWDDSWWLADENGDHVPVQVLTQEALSSGSTRLLFSTQIEPGNWRVLRVMRSPKEALLPASGEFLADWSPDSFQIDEKNWPVPKLQLIEDESDTWSHGLDRYGDITAGEARWNLPVVVDDGPRLKTWIQQGIIGNSRLEAEWRTYAGRKFIELQLRVHWSEEHRLLKLVWPLNGAYGVRVDGISGGMLRRPNDGRELPLRDWSCFLSGEGQIGAAVVCPDVFAADATPERLRLTLLRSALLAHHVPHSGESPHRTFSDQGVHSFRFRFYGSATPDELDATAMMLHQPPLSADLTRGMPGHLSEA